MKFYFKKNEEIIEIDALNEASLSPYVQSLPKPTDEELNTYLLAKEKERKKEECLSYLKNTDWYVIRFSDPSSQTSIPESITIKRMNARIWQNDIDHATTLEELATINVTFD